MHCFTSTLDDTPAKAGAHPEISGWIPACAGMTPRVSWVARETSLNLMVSLSNHDVGHCNSDQVQA